MQRVKNESNQLQWNPSKTPEESVLVSLFLYIYLGRERRGGVLSSGVSLYCIYNISFSEHPRSSIYKQMKNPVDSKKEHIGMV